MDRRIYRLGGRFEKWENVHTSAGRRSGSVSGLGCLVRGGMAVSCGVGIGKVCSDGGVGCEAAEGRVTRCDGNAEGSKAVGCAKIEDRSCW